MQTRSFSYWRKHCQIHEHVGSWEGLSPDYQLYEYPCQMAYEPNTSRESKANAGLFLPEPLTGIR